MLRSADRVRNEVSEERIASIITLMMEAIRTSETSVPTRATRKNIPDNGILQSHRR
jgi:hypothetical protein